MPAMAPDLARRALELVSIPSVSHDEAAAAAYVAEAMPGEPVFADDLSTVPYLQGAQVAVTGTNVNGAEDTLDASFKFRYGALSKG